MAKTRTEWLVRSNDPIEELAENLWRVQGSVPGMSLRRNMTIARRSDGRLVIYNAIALDEPAMQRIEQWGPPSFLVVPNGQHRLDAPAYKHRYPGLTVMVAPGARAKIARVVAVDATLDAFPADGAVRFEPLQGIGDLEGVMFVESRDGATVILGDAVFNMDRKRDLLGAVFTTLMGSAPGPRVSRLVKAVMIKDRAALRRDLQRLASTPRLVRLIVAHEKVASGDAAAAALRQAATYL